MLDWEAPTGGYSDMQTQRGIDIAQTRPVRVSASRQTRPADLSAPSRAKKKLSFNEKYALDNLPKQMTKLEGEIAALQKKLEDPGLYARDRNAFDAATAAIGKAQADLSEAEEKWLALEMLREEIEGA
jgi:ATP-binding cassette subfamily F protein uup